MSKGVVINDGLTETVIMQIRNRIKALEYIDSKDLTPHPGNWRDHPKAQADALLGVLKEVGIAGALLAYRSERQGGALVVIDGHLRKDAAPTKWPVLVLDVDDAEADYLLATHDPLAAMATADAGALDALLSSVNSGEAAVQAMLAELAESAGLYEPREDDDGERQEQARQTLAERFLVPPFSVLDARQGYWQNRKRAWIALGLRGELGRSVTANALPKTFRNSTQGNRVDTRLGMDNGASIFDPVLCEIAYRWFCPPSGHIVNPTAGESVYGIVAGYLGYTYEGVEIRQEQIEANEQQARDIGIEGRTKWIHGDGRNTSHLVSPADLVMCCPPYHDLEVYSDDPQDISTLDDYDEFMSAYRQIVASAVDALKPNRFACFVVGDIRDKQGHYRNFVSDTIGAFRAAGCELYNEAILITALGTVMMQTSRNFPIGRKLGKSHQNVLIFIKGDWRKAVEACGPVSVEVPDGFGTDNYNDN